MKRHVYEMLIMIIGLFYSQITTLILDRAMLTRSTLRAFLSLRSLRSVRFIKVEAVDDEDEDNEQDLDGTLLDEVRLCFNLHFIYVVCNQNWDNIMWNLHLHLHTFVNKVILYYAYFVRLFLHNLFYLSLMDSKLISDYYIRMLNELK